MRNEPYYVTLSIFKEGLINVIKEQHYYYYIESKEDIERYLPRFNTMQHLYIVPPKVFKYDSKEYHEYKNLLKLKLLLLT